MGQSVAVHTENHAVQARNPVSVPAGGRITGPGVIESGYAAVVAGEFLPAS